MSSEGETDELQTWFRDGVGWPTSLTCAVTSKVKGQCNKVTSSVWCMFAQNSTIKSGTSTKIGSSVVRAIVDLPHQFQCKKGQRSRSPGRLTPWPNNSHIFGTGRPAIFELGMGWSTISRIIDTRGALKDQRSRSPGRSWWLFKSPLAGGGGILWRPQ